MHHVVAKGNAGGLIAHDDHDRRSLLIRLERAAMRCHWSCLAYCLMDTHIHLIIRTPDPNLGYGMQRFLSPYAQAFNRRHMREGHLFRGRFYSRRIATTEHLQTAVVYVLMNPVRAGIVGKPEVWPWSSCAATLGHVPVAGLLDVAAVLELVEADPNTARRRLESTLRTASQQDRIDDRA